MAETDIQSLHSAEYKTRPTVVGFAPGVVHLLGEHVERAGVPTLSIALQRGVSVAVSPRRDLSLRFYAPDIGERRRTGVTSIKPRREDRWANVPKGVIAHVLERGHRMKGLDVTIAGNVPISRGLASSTAVCVALSLALERLLDLPRGGIDPIHAAYHAEKEYAGMRPSEADAAISSLCSPGTIVIYRHGSRRVEPVGPIPGDTRLILIDSQVPPQADDEEDYDAREHVLLGCADFEPDRAVSPPPAENEKSRNNGPAAGNNARHVRDELNDHLEGLSARERRTCLHVMRELERVELAKEAVVKGEPEQVGRLLSRSHADIGDLLELSCPELDWLARRTQDSAGVYGSRLTGPGLGGYLATLCRPDAFDGLEAQLAEYDSIFGFNAGWIEVETGESAQVHEIGD
ncbi:MAG: galactokinase [Spirochaetales bacterium]